MPASKFSILAATTDPDPRVTAPAVDRRLDLKERNPQTDQQPSALLLALEGTAGNTAVVSVYWSPANPQDDQALQKWYLIASGITVTVGQAVRAPAAPGLCAVQVTTAPAANATLIALPLCNPAIYPAS